MDDEKITYKDIEKYGKLFTLAPSFLLERFARKNTNVVLKFESKAKDFISNLNDYEKNKLDIVLNSDIDELQSLMIQAYEDTGKKQFKILANPKYKEFIRTNLDEIEKMVKN